MQVIQCNVRSCGNNKNGFCYSKVIYISETGKCKEKNKD
ncbi:hypothetical protein SAMN02194393_04596 [Maledivibacter halophilus]|uniref:DUF1540 domain-containing protein n=1 Tax=Maledivibacter halophilus TaxID=36842 RepID=A0A1T5MFA2_9FIRM|nr:hypothetical protein SAMN02194393_04596 [Maledivibacter halophilus]